MQGTRQPHTAAAICNPAPQLAGSQRKTGNAGKKCEKLRFCQRVPVGELTQFLPHYCKTLVCLLYCKKEEGETLTPEPRKLHREQIRTNSTAHGLQLLGADSRHKRFSCHRTAPNQDKRATLRRVSDLPVGVRLVYQFTDLITMNNPTTFCVVLASYITAGLFGVCFVQTALQSPLQQHSGTQSYVRVVR